MVCAGGFKRIYNQLIYIMDEKEQQENSEFGVLLKRSKISQN